MKSKIREIIEQKKPRSAWARGVKEYALEMLEEIEGEITEENALNGAKNWSEYSYGGCSYIYDAQIAEKLCTKSELKRNRRGELAPNRWETWLDVQARALRQAWSIIERSKKEAEIEE